MDENTLIVEEQGGEEQSFYSSKGNPASSTTTNENEDTSHPFLSSCAYSIICFLLLELFADVILKFMLVGSLHQNGHKGYAAFLGVTVCIVICTIPIMVKKCYKIIKEGNELRYVIQMIVLFRFLHFFIQDSTAIYILLFTDDIYDETPETISNINIGFILANGLLWSIIVIIVNIFLFFFCVFHALLVKANTGNNAGLVAYIILLFPSLCSIGSVVLPCYLLIRLLVLGYDEGFDWSDEEKKDGGIAMLVISYFIAFLLLVCGSCYRKMEV
jgi:hypothetical protein